MEQDILKRGKKGPKTSARGTGAEPKVSGAAAIAVSKETNMEQEGRLRYKILTNFVNAYKDKMFLSNSPGKGADGAGGSEDIMTLEDLKAHT